MKDFKELLTKGAIQLDLEISEESIEEMEAFYILLDQWGKGRNLTAIVDLEKVVEKHFLDSLLCIKYIKTKGMALDVGTGAGFPGMPVFLARCLDKIYLLDSVKKKIEFLEHVVKERGYNNIYPLHNRAEDLGKDKSFRENMDYVLSRAVASLNLLAEYTLPFLKVGGYFICQKGPSVEDELTHGSFAVETLGGIIEERVSYQLPFSEGKREILIIKKIRNTPEKYPRKAGLPEKRPLKK